MGLDRLPRALAWCAFLTVCVAPFLSGAVERSVWIPLCELWLVLGLVSVSIQSRDGSAGPRHLGEPATRALLPFHALYFVQLIPLPKALLAWLSPGSYAAHFLPDPGDGRFRPLSVSPSATTEAWLYFTGLQGLFLVLLGLPREKRERLLKGLLLVALVLAGEGLWQSRSPHPHWLYGRVPVNLPTGFETSVFGPYLNRNHFATVTAMGAGLSAGLAASLIRSRGGLVRALAAPRELSHAILFSGASAFLVLVSAASGSRSGMLAAVLATAVAATLAFGRKILVVALSLGVVAVTLAGASAIERLLRLDFMASRLGPWRDMAGLFRFFPGFGSGFGTFSIAYWPYQNNVRYEFWQYAHNEYLQFVLEAGVAGLLALYFAARSLRASGYRSDAMREPLIGLAVALSAQALLDFPLRIPANAALAVCAFSLFAGRRHDQTHA